MNDRACFKCRSQDHFFRDCPELNEKDRYKNARPTNTANRGRPPRNVGNMTSSRGTTKDSTVRSEARAPARAYAIHANEDASSPDVITGTFPLYDTNVIALIDPGSTHSYICMNLVSNKSLPIESTEFVVKVSNPLGKYVLVDKVCKNYPLMIWGYCFPTDLMPLPFNEFDVILGIDWLSLHDAVNSDILRIESDDSRESPVVISSMSAQRCVRKGCEAYFAYVLDTKVSESKIESLPVVCEYSNVFPEELLGYHRSEKLNLLLNLCREHLQYR
ncbi:Gag-Pol polyprotein [Gossypium australe]|uniref:Gag-Pol polyprotein n=1 Tax=Gossypium australe TaxID=47621 RepID=A0A5B6WH77_9ROSI|nr:Gag-Pol polyprotein [Gossypium australe]